MASFIVMPCPLLLLFVLGMSFNHRKCAFQSSAPPEAFQPCGWKKQRNRNNQWPEFFSFRLFLEASIPNQRPAAPRKKLFGVKSCCFFCKKVTPDLMSEVPGSSDAQGDPSDPVLMAGLEEEGVEIF